MIKYTTMNNDDENHWEFRFCFTVLICYIDNNHLKKHKI